MCLSELDMMVESILMAMDEHGCKHADGHWMTVDELYALSDEEVIALYNQIYGGFEYDE